MLKAKRRVDGVDTPCIAKLTIIAAVKKKKLYRNTATKCNHSTIWFRCNYGIIHSDIQIRRTAKPSIEHTIKKSIAVEAIRASKRDLIGLLDLNGSYSLLNKNWATKVKTQFAVNSPIITHLKM